MYKINHNTSNLLTCISEILIGILLLIDPVGFTSSIIVVFGIILTILGISNLFSYFRNDVEIASQQSSLAKGLVFGVFGLFCVLKSEWFIATFPILTILYGILTLVVGIGKVQWL